jgi:ubiquinone/menaquinone biosynthesis C-methylase UbiE
VRTGRTWFRQRGVTDVRFAVTKADDLSQFPDKSIDIVLTDAALICVAPDAIHAAISEIVRVARKAAVLLEWHADGRTPNYRDHWVYNYRWLFKPHVPDPAVTVTKLPPHLWGGDWGRYGYVIEVRM